MFQTSNAKVAVVLLIIFHSKHMQPLHGISQLIQGSSSPSSLTHLRRRFNLITGELLRNDSLADMSDRHGLYFELLEWLEVLMLALLEWLFLKYCFSFRQFPHMKVSAV